MFFKKSTISFHILFIASLAVSSKIFVHDFSNHQQTRQNTQTKNLRTFPENVQQQNVEQRNVEQQNVEQRYRIVAALEYVQTSKLIFKQKLLEKFIQAKRKFDDKIRRLRSYEYTPEEQEINQVLITEQGLISLPTIHKAHAAIGLFGGFTAGAAVPIVATARAALGGGNDSVSAGNSCPATQPEQKKAPTDLHKDCKKSENSSSVHGSIPLSGSRHTTDTSSAKTATQVKLNPAQPSASATTVLQGKAQCKPDRAIASDREIAKDKEQFDRDKNADHADSATFKKSIQQDIVFSSSDNAKSQIVKDFEVQKAHNQERRDRAINAVASVAVVGLQRYDQQQKKARKEKKIAKWSQERENDIQRRMRAECKSRWQIEEEDRLLLKKAEQFQIEERKKQAEKNQKKSKPEKQQRKSDVNRTSNSGPDKDPDDDDKKDSRKSNYVREVVDDVVDLVVDRVADAIVDKVLDLSKVIYEGNPKHHLNSTGNASKPPHDGKANIKESVWVKTNKNGLSQRVAIENGKVVVYKEHAPNRYHGYIEENVKGMEDFFKKALYKAGFIQSVKSCKVIRK